MSFNSLPREIQLKIFSHLTPDELVNLAGPVSQLWDNLAFDPILWKIIYVYLNERSPDQLTRIFKSARLLRFLFCNYVHNINIPNYPFLKTLVIESANVDVDNVKKFVDRAPLVERFSFSTDTFDYEFIRQIVRWTRLKSLKLEFFGTVNVSDTLDLIAANCPNLRVFSFNYTVDVDDDRPFLKFIDTYVDTIQSLNVNFNGITDESYESLSKCRKLQILRLQICSRSPMTIRGLMALRKLEHCLQDLLIVDAYQFTCENWCSLFSDVIFQISVLHLRACPQFTAHCALKVTKSCPNLKRFLIVNCSGVCDKTIEIILFYCPNIKTLYLELVDITGECFTKFSHLTAPIRVIFGPCHKLQLDFIQHAELMCPRLSFHVQ